MSGRAGRRGLDQRGIVILIANDKMEPIELQQMLKGKSDRLMSQFHVTYPMLMQLQRLEDVAVTYIITRSFMQFQKLERIPTLKSKKKKLEQDIANNYQFKDGAQELEVERYWQMQRTMNDFYV